MLYFRANKTNASAAIALVRGKSA